MKHRTSFFPRVDWRLALSAALLTTAWILPADAQRMVTETIHGREYVSGQVYLTAHADTALLTPLGFRNFDFQGWSGPSCRYATLWPVTVESNQLPRQVSGIECAMVTGPKTVEYAAWISRERSQSLVRGVMNQRNEVNYSATAGSRTQDDFDMRANEIEYPEASDRNDAAVEASINAASADGADYETGRPDPNGELIRYRQLRPEYQYISPYRDNAQGRGQPQSGSNWIPGPEGFTIGVSHGATSPFIGNPPGSNGGQPPK
jgi:hypothetical protein